jgi:predicted aspartyl protease
VDIWNPRCPVKSLADGLPPEIAQQIHPDWRRNEAAYWFARDRLLEQFRGQWIGYADGAVIASGTSPVDVFHRAQASGLHPYFTCVGWEDEPCQMRRCSYSYDTTYRGEALPVMSVEFRTTCGSPGTVLDRVILDTGADASALPWSDCQQMQLAPIQGVPGIVGGVGGSRASTVVFHVWAWLDGTEHPCRIHADFLGSERILGRDVLNRMEVLFRRPAGEVVINP